MKRRQQWKNSRPEHRNQACRNRPAHSVALFTKCCLPVRTESYYFTSDPNIQDEKKVSSEDATGSNCSWRIGACFLCTARSVRAVPVWQLSDKVHSLQSTSPVAQLSACLWYLIHSPPEWRTRQEKKKKGSEQATEPPWQRWRNVLIYQWCLWKHLQSNGEHGERHFHMFRYGDIILACTGLNLNFGVMKTACLWPVKHALYICSSHLKNLH